MASIMSMTYLAAPTVPEAALYMNASPNGFRGPVDGHPAVQRVQARHADDAYVFDAANLLANSAFHRNGQPVQLQNR